MNNGWNDRTLKTKQMTLEPHWTRRFEKRMRAKREMIENWYEFRDLGALLGGLPSLIMGAGVLRILVGVIKGLLGSEDPFGKPSSIHFRTMRYPPEGVCCPGRSCNCFGFIRPVRAGFSSFSSSVIHPWGSGNCFEFTSPWGNGHCFWVVCPPSWERELFWGHPPPGEWKWLSSSS